MPIALAFALGVLLLQQSPQLPALPILLAAFPLALALFRPFPWLAAFLVGLGYAGLHAHIALGSTLAPDWEMKDLTAEGRILALPDRRGGRTRFLFRIESLHDGEAPVSFSGTARLSWHGEARPPLRAGEGWSLRVRLKRPHGLLNPGLFDYEAWLWREGIGATGYIRKSDRNRRLPGRDGRFSLDPWRQALGDALASHLPEGAAALIRALAIGDGNGFTPEQWDSFRKTGTNHLVSISGLHVGLAAGLLLVLTEWLWRLSPALCLRLAAPKAGALAGILGALFYTALAGFLVPTQRALVMIAALLMPRLLAREVRPWQGFALALILVLLFDPRAVMSPGFLLSFAAVAAIFWGLAGRRKGGYLLSLARLQWVILLLITPLTLFLFNQTSLLAFPVNLLAVPWFSLVLVPAALLAVLLFALVPVWGLWLFGWIAPLYTASIEGLQAVAALDAGMLELTGRPLVLLVLASLGAAWLAVPLHVPARYLGLTLILPFALWREAPFPDGAFEATLLDVGQGLSVAVRTANHLLLYDTGPAYPGGFDAGDSVVLPYLRAAGAGRLDRLLVSHPSMDHAGGAKAVIAGMPVVGILGNPGQGVASIPCRAGQAWRWDAVDFRILHPGQGEEWNENNSSCVLAVSNPAGQLLLTGDLERAGEEAMLARYGGQLRSRVVQAGHHGSRTSSSPLFVRTVAPQWTLIANGYRNRFGFPSAEVVRRWRAAGAGVLETADGGALSFQFHPGGGLIGPVRERERRARFWRQ
ncbi:MAG: DNA internalization-related competence protein ComEC/Rec2 [Gammaproteobacteria bacterium]|nr:DNA internalization-related competence protein ComEC/Rec2 [Gammaproteobacteria bacterium]MBU1655491.1 DNA internalization-related competence protein ComEC/Rec2 [Gammaproteobacteria bacterium]MBU1961692.1 DNA internalization-related competence protein ComEC/Rec2 [Gammaproteobacteria bacterium]